MDGVYDGTGGTVFKLTPGGVTTVLHRFAGSPHDGANPGTSLIDVGGTLYGTTQAGGSPDYNFFESGTVFKISPSGAESVLHYFTDEGDGVYPSGDLLDVGGALYGATCYGGENGYGYGDGTVYSLTTSGNETVLYSFEGYPNGGPDGVCPIGRLVAVNGTLYGTTNAGGSNSDGTVFALSLTGTETVIHSFAGGSDGAFPAGGLTAIGGTLYGTTQSGGAHGRGTVFSISTAGTEHVVHSFGGGSDGIGPLAQLTNVNGTLYGTTYGGGSHGFGTVFALTP